jgi:DNA recombination protein RmuC
VEEAPRSLSAPEFEALGDVATPGAGEGTLFDDAGDRPEPPRIRRA